MRPGVAASRQRWSVSQLENPGAGTARQPYVALLCCCRLTGSLLATAAAANSAAQPGRHRPAGGGRVHRSLRTWSRRGIGDQEHQLSGPSFQRVTLYFCRVVKQCGPHGVRHGLIQTLPCATTRVLTTRERQVCRSPPATVKQHRGPRVIHSLHRLRRGAEDVLQAVLCRWHRAAEQCYHRAALREHQSSSRTSRADRTDERSCLAGGPTAHPCACIRQAEQTVRLASV